MIDLLHATYHHLIQHLTIKTHRFLYSDFNIKNRLTGVIGPRGVGKTTLFLQYIKEHLYAQEEAFYFTADHVYFNQMTLLEFVTQLYRADGIKTVFIDEIHKYKNWSQELKNIYDTLPDLRVVFSGSSSLDLVKGTYDLSRRAKLFYLPGLSFREYLHLRTGKDFPVLKLKELLAHPMQYNNKLGNIPKILAYFKDYLVDGYYPFVFEDKSSYQEKILRIIEKTIYEDIAEFYNLKTENLFYLKKIVSFLATIPPGEVNTQNIAKNLGIDHKTAFNYLTMLHETNLVRMLYSSQTGNRILTKPEKIFLHNSSLLYALNSTRGELPSIGTARELLIFQSISDAGNPIFYNPRGDFISEKYILEVGGKNKNFSQLKDINHLSLLIKDDITVATKNVIPLYYFGFLY
jgi:predicted AAA+ superfamily ATPase